MFYKAFNTMQILSQGGRPVPVIIPSDAVSPLNFLASSDVREAAGISTSNSYLFPNSGMVI